MLCQCNGKTSFPNCSWTYNDIYRVIWQETLFENEINKLQAIQ
jgi:hypothetical protein